jgi:hypothetical protein
MQVDLLYDSGRIEDAILTFPPVLISNLIGDPPFLRLKIKNGSSFPQPVVLI